MLARRYLGFLSLAILAHASIAGAQTPPTKPATPPKPASQPAKPPAKPAPANYKEIARKLVVEVARVGKGDLVTVAGDVRDVALLEEIALGVARAGGAALPMMWRETSRKRWFDEVPAANDASHAAFELKLAAIEDVVIMVYGEERPDQLKNVDPARLAAVNAAEQKVEDLRAKRKVRRVVLGNGLYPTAATAKQFGIKLDSLVALFWAGVNTDYAALSAVGEGLRAVLAKGKEVEVKTPGGTALKLRIARRPVFVSDGVISEEDVRRGPAGTVTWLPAGEVYVTPVPGSVEGTLVVPRMPYEESTIEELKITFQRGKAVEITAKPTPGFERWKARYDAAPPGREEFAMLDVGINRDVKIPAGTRLVSFVAAGSLTVGIGNNAWAGGANKVPFSTYFPLTDATVTVDGVPIVANGALQSPGVGQPAAPAEPVAPVAPVSPPKPPAPVPTPPATPVK